MSVSCRSSCRLLRAARRVHRPGGRRARTRRARSRCHRSGMGDDEHRLADVVEDHHAVVEGERQVGQVAVVLGRRSAAARCSGRCRTRRSRPRRRRTAAGPAGATADTASSSVSQIVERIVDGVAFRLCRRGSMHDVVAVGLDPQERIGAEEAVPADRLAADDALEQERVAVDWMLAVGADRRERVAEELRDRRERAGRGPDCRRNVSNVGRYRFMQRWSALKLTNYSTRERLCRNQW